MLPTQITKHPPWEGAWVCHVCSQSKAFVRCLLFLVCIALLLRQGGLVLPTVLWDGPP